jgi:hypothetical protein
MSYYILPKKSCIPNIMPLLESSKKSESYISYSLFHYLNEQLKEVATIKNDEFLKIINPYEFLFTKVPSYKFAVSKLRPPANSFYILMELSHIFNLFDSFSRRNITTMHFSSCPEAIIECLDVLREEMHDVNIISDLFNCIENLQINHIHSIDFMYFDLDTCDNETVKPYLNSLLAVLLNILIYQSRNGISIIKIGNIFHKVVLDVIFLLTSLFEKVYIIKPNTSNIFSSDKFIVCKIFEPSCENNIYIDNLKKLLSKLFTGETTEILSSLIRCELPYYFLSKIEELNAIIGQQQLESYDQALNLMKNKNKDEKIETLKKINIQKCIQMCEKFKIPYNKFSDKVNIFLQSHVLEENFIEPNIFLNHPQLSTQPNNIIDLEVIDVELDSQEKIDKDL